MSRMDPMPPSAALPLADPFIYQDAGCWYLIGSELQTNDQQPGLATWFSRDRHRWSPAGGIFTIDAAPGFCQITPQRPQIVCRNNRYYLFFDAPTTHGHGIGIARANSPLGPFISPLEQSITDPDQFAANPHVHIDRGGNIYLIYVQQTGDRMPQRIVCRQMSTDMMRLTGNPTVLLETHQIPWAESLHSPWLFVYEKRHYLLMTTGTGQNARIGYLTAKHLNDTWTDGGLILNTPAGGSCILPGDQPQHWLLVHHRFDANNQPIMADQRLTIEPDHRLAPC